MAISRTEEEQAMVAAVGDRRGEGVWAASHVLLGATAMAPSALPA